MLVSDTKYWQRCVERVEEVAGFVTNNSQVLLEAHRADEQRVKDKLKEAVSSMADYNPDL